MKTKFILIACLLVASQAFAQFNSPPGNTSSGARFFNPATQHRFIQHQQSKSSLDVIDFAYRLDSLVIPGYFKYNFEYDSSNRIILDIESEYNFDDLIWNTMYKSTYSYNTEGLISLTEEFNFEDGNWVPSNKFEYEYDANGKITQLIESYWDNTELVWYPNKMVYEYDGNGNMILQTRSYWEASSSTWLITDKTEYEYNASNQLISETNYYYDSFTVSWTPAGKSVYTLDTYGNATFSEYQSWDSVTETWITNYQAQSEFTYDGAGNILSETTYDWDEMASAWIPNSKNESTYDSFNNQLSEIYLEWNGSDFEATEKSEFTYNTNVPREAIASPEWFWEDMQAHHMLTSATMSQWIAIAWVPFFEAELYYTPLLSNPEFTLNPVNVYPNPANSSAGITILGLDNETAYFNLLDLSGKVIYSTSINSDTQLILPEVATGLYLYQIKDQAGNSHHGKLILQ